MESPNLIFQDNHFVGYIKQVSPKFVTIHFPSSTLLKKFYWNSESLQAGIVGNFILIEGEDHGFLGQIIEIGLPEKERISLNQTAFERDDFHPMAKAEILLSFTFYNLHAEKGLSQLPPIGSKVFVCSNEILLRFLKDFGKNSNYPNEPNFELASLPNNISEKVTLSPQAIFGRHCAIVGTTGGGKSYTVTKLIEEIIKHKGKAILFDATGEYEPLSKNASVAYYRFNDSGGRNIFYHHTALRETDYYSIFRPAGQIQLPKLQEAFKSLRLAKMLREKPTASLTESDKSFLDTFINDKGLVIKENKERNSLLSTFSRYPEVDSISCKLDIRKLGYQTYYECIYEHHTNNPNSFGGKNDRDLGLCYSLISRINITINNKDFISVFGLNESSDSKNSFSEVYNSFIADNNKNVLVISVDKVPTENNLQTILINAFGRFLLQNALNKKYKASPLLVFLDEAHLFLNKSIADEFSIETHLNAFDRIAKECRKFGLFLTLSTQMPRDIPIGILSQFGTFIVHRLINQRDRETIEFACSEATKSALSFLPSLMPGQALITGVEFPMPIILQIEKPSFEPDSKTPRIFK